MIIGIGTDLIEIHRVERACEKEGFISRVYSEREREFLGPISEKYADNFAVKEAVSKMFGTGFRGIQMNEIEVFRDELGKPYVKLNGAAERLAQRLMIRKIHVTITNTKEYASAYVIGEG